MRSGENTHTSIVVRRDTCRTFAPWFGKGFWVPNPKILLKLPPGMALILLWLTLEYFRNLAQSAREFRALAFGGTVQPELVEVTE
jgi:hypothetical protein